jgi:large subunit ribosomal protein L13
MAYRHSGYPGGLTATPYGEFLDTKPERAIEKAVRGMIPKTSLGRTQMTHLKVYAGSEHPHTAQQAKPFEITQVSQQA